jgi:hypothetical protein
MRIGFAMTTSGSTRTKSSRRTPPRCRTGCATTVIAFPRSPSPAGATSIGASTESRPSSMPLRGRVYQPSSLRGSISGAVAYPVRRRPGARPAQADDADLRHSRGRSHANGVCVRLRARRRRRSRGAPRRRRPARFTEQQRAWRRSSPHHARIPRAGTVLPVVCYRLHTCIHKGSSRWRAESHLTLRAKLMAWNLGSAFMLRLPRAKKGSCLVKPTRRRPRRRHANLGPPAATSVTL